MGKLVIFTDSGADYMKDIKLDHVVVIPNSYCLKGEDTVYNGADFQNRKAFFDYMGLDVEIQYNSVNREELLKKMNEYASAGYNIICITSASAINYGNYEVFREARELSIIKHMHSSIAVVDSKSFSLVQKLIVQYANLLAEKETGFEEALFKIIHFRDSFEFDAMLGNTNNDIIRYCSFNAIENLKNKLNLNTVYNLAGGVKSIKHTTKTDRVELLLAGLFRKNKDNNVVGIVHTNAAEEAQKLQEALTERGFVSYKYEPNLMNSIVYGDKSLGLVYQKR